MAFTDSQQWPTTTYEASSDPSFNATRGCCAPYKDGLSTSVMPGIIRIVSESIAKDRAQILWLTRVQLNESMTTFSCVYNVLDGTQKRP